MKSHLPGFLALVGCLTFTGCSTPVSNPSSPKANTGYVDFYTESSLDLAWEIRCADQKTGEMRTVYSKYKPMAGTTLRLASTPGNRRFRIWIMNRVTEGPQVVQVRVEDGKVTPVHVTLTQAGTNAIRSKEYGFRPSAKGYGRGTKITSEESESFRVGAVAESPQPYRVKELMPYFVAAPK